MTNLITEARELYDGWAAYDIMRHGGGQGAKSDDGEAERKFMLWIADEFPAMCDALEKATQNNDELIRELAQLARESVERDMALAKLEAKVEDALREQAEREKGCAFCTTGAHRILQNALYCPRCGKRLERKHE